MPNQDLQPEDQVQDSFPELWYDIVNKDHFWFYWRYKTLLSVLKKLKISLQGNHRAFDIGSGNALLINQLESVSNWTIDGCDINPKFVGSLNIRGDYFEYDIFEKRESLREKYDFIFLFDILEHLSDPKAFLDTASFYLKQGGVIFINVPAFQSLYSNYDKAVGHKMRYNKEAINSWLGSGLFSIEDLRYWGMALAPLVAARKVLNARSTDDVKIITQGMKIPGRLVNSILRLGADVETFVIPSPSFGCSLMLTLRKK